MHLKIPVLAACLALARAQNLTTLLASSSDLSNLTTYLALYPNFTETLAGLTGVTLLAPSNEAFAKLANSSGGSAIAANDTVLVESLLSYHILDGVYYASDLSHGDMFIPTALENPLYSNVTGGQRVEALGVGSTVTFYSGLLANATVTHEDMNFTGGVVQIIDNFLTIPQNITTTGVVFNLTSAVGALTQTNLVNTIDGLTDVTVFLPSNDAFQAVASQVASLSLESLIAILQYHIVSGKVVYSSDLGNTTLTTADGSNLTITVEDDHIFVNSAAVVIQDLLVANGVVHVIDNVLNPQNTTATPNPSASTQAPAFTGSSGTSSATIAPFTSGVSKPTSSVASTKATSSTQSAFAPGKTGAVGAAALFGGAAALMNI